MLLARPQKITLGETRIMAIRGLLVYCSDYSHSAMMSEDSWPDHFRLSDLEPLIRVPGLRIKGAETERIFSRARLRKPG
jgi:hypothetical protein